MRANIQSQYVAVVLLRGGRMMFGPHAAEIAGHFYRGLMQKEHPTQASREDSSSTSSRAIARPSRHSTAGGASSM